MGDFFRDLEQVAEASERAFTRSGSVWEAVAAGVWEGARIVGEEIDSESEPAERSPGAPEPAERSSETPAVASTDVSHDEGVIINRTLLLDQAGVDFERPEDLRSFREDIAAFEQRASREGMDPLEVARTYHEIRDLMAHRDGAVIDQDRREQLAREVLHQAAFPYGIDQGRHNTCTVSTLEARLYARNPSAAAGTVRELATSSTGEFTTTDGRRVRVDASSLTPDSEAARQPRPDGERTYASQILQLAMVNAHWSQQTVHGEGASRPTGPFTYRQQHNVSDQDSGERLIDGTGRTVAAAPDIRAQDLPGIYRQFSSEQSEPFVIVHRSRISRDANGSYPDGVIVVDTEEDLRRAVSDQQSQRNMPPIVQVDPARAPWSNAGGRLPAAGAGREPLGEYAQAAAVAQGDTNPQPRIQPRPGPIPVNRERNSHVVNIVSMTTDGGNGRPTAHVSNSWGDSSDMDVDLPTLFRSL